MTTLKVIFAVLLTWGLSIVLTLTDVFPVQQGQWGYEARTDLRTEVIFTSPWWRIPFPGF